MGVPAFFRWLCKKYPAIVVQAAEEKAKKNDYTGEKIPADTSEPNPNGIEFDNLYLDMNGIIHPCTHPEDRPAPKNEDEMMVIIFEFIDRIFSIVRPRKLLYMAIDGVAPRAKMNQQRSRRFRAAKDGSEKTSELKRIREQILANGGQVPPEVPHDEKFDSNCITPGTPFMHKLAECLRYYVHDRLNNDPGWKNITVILSDANVPGEGEHKIMDYIRRQRANPDHDPNTHHVLCGADADLIMLGLATHEPYFTIIREEFKPDRPRPCEVCNQFGHDTKECCGLTREKAGAHDEFANSFTPSEQHYIFLRLSILREYLNKELYLPDLPFKFDIERAIDDWIFMCFFVGNDFLPHLPSLEIRENAIDRLVNLYKKMIHQTDGYLTDCGNVHLERVEYILSSIGEVEDDIFKKRQQTEMEFRQRQKDKKRRIRNQQQYMNGDMPNQMPAWMKSGPYGMQPLGRGAKQQQPASTENRFQALEQPMDEGDEAKRGIKRKLDAAAAAKTTAESEAVDPAAATTKKPDDSIDDVQIVEDPAVVLAAIDTPTEDEDLDEDANDPVKLWEDGWKNRYYKVKFDVDDNDEDFRIKLAHHYTIGLQWVLKYYYQGVPSWNWYFPYHYAPFASDFVNLKEAQANFEEITEPFRPFEQLMAVFPAASKKHIPLPWQILMTDTQSPIIDFYPEDFQVDLNGKKQSWQGVALLPFVDEKRLKRALEPYLEKLSPEEKKRNTRGHDRLFVGQKHKLYNLFKELYTKDDGLKAHKNLKHSIDLATKESGGVAGKIWCDENVCMEDETLLSPIRYLCTDLKNNRVMSVHYHDPIYESDFVFKAVILSGAKIPDAFLKPEDFDNGGNNNRYRPNLGFNRNYDYRNNKDASAANRMVRYSMNSEVISSAHGGHSSIYGEYRSNTVMPFIHPTPYNNNNNNNNQNNNYQNNNNNRYNNNNNRNNYNNNYNNNNNNNNNNNAGGYNNNNRNNNRNNYNNNNNYNSNRNFNNNGGSGGGGAGNYNNNNNNNSYNRQQSDNGNQQRYNNNNNNSNNNNNTYNNNNRNQQQQQQNRQQNSR